jgi:hypothetical protein
VYPDQANTPRKFKDPAVRAGDLRSVLMYAEQWRQSKTAAMAHAGHQQAYRCSAAKASDRVLGSALASRAFAQGSGAFWAGDDSDDDDNGDGA